MSIKRRKTQDTKLPFLTILFISISVLFLTYQCVNHFKKTTISDSLKGIFGAYNEMQSKDLWFNVDQIPQIDDFKKKPLIIVFADILDGNFINKLDNIDSILELNKTNNVIVIATSELGKDRAKESRKLIRNSVVKYHIEVPLLHDKDGLLQDVFNIKSDSVLVLNSVGKIYNSYSMSEVGLLINDVKGLMGGKKSLRSKFDIELEKDKTPDLLLKHPTKMAYSSEVSANGNKPVIFVSDYAYHRVIGLSLSGEIVLEIGGDNSGYMNGNISLAKFNYPTGLAYLNQKLYVADTLNNKIRVIDFKANKVSDLDIKKATSKIDVEMPYDIKLDSKNNRLLITSLKNNKILSYLINEKKLSVLFEGNEECGNKAVDVDDKGNVYALNNKGNLSIYNRKSEKVKFYKLSGGFADIENDLDDSVNDGKSNIEANDEAVKSGDIGSLIEQVEKGSSGEQDELAKLIEENGGIKTKPKSKTTKQKSKKANNDSDKGIKEIAKKKVLTGNKEDYLNKPSDLYIDDTGVYVIDTGNNVIRKVELSDESDVFVIRTYSKGSSSKIRGGDKISYDNPSDMINVRDRVFISDTDNGRILILNRNDGSMETLHIRPKSVTGKNILDGYLPNLTYIKSIELGSNEPIKVVLNLDKKWSLTENAPNFLHLFRIDSKNNEAVLMGSYSTKDLQDLEIELPKLETGNMYYLQGTLYYCNGEPNSPCLIKSYKQKLEIKESSSKKKIKMNFLY